LLTQSRSAADYFEAAAKTCVGSPRTVANWIAGDLSSLLNENNLDISQSPVSPGMLARLIDRIEDGTISGKIAKDVFRAMWDGEGDADAIIGDKGLKQITDTAEIEKIIDDVLSRSEAQIEQYRSGQEKVFGYFVGQVMKATAGKANPKQVNEMLRKKLDD
ncbi:MAG: Asp-tRNA(Asn)/Glu-tRNA(Gln) amidotransferase GatCAB subunit B, partial [Arenicellales bacterium]